MRREIKSRMGIDALDIYGLSVPAVLAAKLQSHAQSFDGCSVAARFVLPLLNGDKRRAIEQPSAARCLDTRVNHIPGRRHLQADLDPALDASHHRFLGIFGLNHFDE